VAARLEAALAHVAPDRLVVAPDCGMKYLSRDVAFGKLAAMVEGTRQGRARLGEVHSAPCLATASPCKTPAPPHATLATSAGLAATAQCAPVQPGPRTTRPGVAPVCSPLRSTCTPLTNTSVMPLAYCCGRS